MVMFRVKPWLAVAALLIVICGCSEQTSAPLGNWSTKTGTSVDTTGNPSADVPPSADGTPLAHGTPPAAGTQAGGTPPAASAPNSTFDLCRDGLQSGKITGFDDFIQEICGAKDELHSFYLANGNIFTGSGDPPLYHNDTTGANSVEVHLLSSSLVNASAKVYFDLVKLQASNPETYKNDGYEYDPATAVTELQPATSASASFHMEYDNGSGGIVKYDATSDFITLADGVAYVSATQGTNYEETVTAFQGMIIVWKKSDTQTYAFTISDQIYSVQSAQIPATESHAIGGAKQEVIRMYQNAQQAQAANL